MPALAFSTQAGGNVDGVVSPGPTATLGVITGGSILVASVAFNISTPDRFTSLGCSDNNGNTWRPLGGIFREPTFGSLGWQFFWVPSANAGSTQAQAQLTCTTGLNTCSITAAEFVKAAGTWEALGSSGIGRSATNPGSPVTAPLWTPPGRPCLYVAAGLGTRVDFTESALDGMNQLTPRTPAAYFHYTSYVIEPQQAQQGYNWTGSDNVLICSAQLVNNGNTATSRPIRGKGASW